MRTKLLSIFLPAIALSLSPMLAQTYQEVVSGKANIFGAGASSLPSPGGGGGVIPNEIQFGTYGPGRSMQISATGTVDCCNGEPNFPDGNTMYGGTNINPYGGLSGIKHANRRMFLVGVFLDNNAPSTEGAPPPTMDYSADFAALSPALRQVFFIGDGLTQGGQPQIFQIPDKATRLFLGFADAWNFQGDPGWYDDDSGSLTVQLKVISTPGADLTYLLPSDVTGVAVAADRVYVLTGGQVVMLDRFTMLPTFGSPIRPTLSNVRAVTAIGLEHDQFPVIAGTLNDPVLGSVMFAQAFNPSQVLPAAQSIIPASLRMTWVGNFEGEATSVNGNSTGDCLYIGGFGNRQVNGTQGSSGIVEKVYFSTGKEHWRVYIDSMPSRVNGISANFLSSSMEVTGWLTSKGAQHGFFQTFAQSGGTAGPRTVWPEASSYGYGVVSGSSTPGVFAFGAIAGAPVGSGPTDATMILRSYTLDGTPVWSQSFLDPGPTPYRRNIAMPAIDSGGVWLGANLQYTSAPSQIFLRYIAANQHILLDRWVAEPSFYLRALGARDGSAYGVGVNPSNSSGFVFKVTGPGAILNLMTQLQPLSTGSMSYMRQLVNDGDWSGFTEAVKALVSVGEITPAQSDSLTRTVRDMLGK